MEIVVVMAGDGTRFKDVGYPLPKPFIEVNEKYILEWTTRSLPFIQHYINHIQQYPLTFAIRSEHEKKFNIIERLEKIYGNNIRVIEFNKLTKGGLETAYITETLTCLTSDDKDVLFLDSDNHYNGSGFENFINDIKSKTDDDFAVICYFEPLDNSFKWCFAFPDGDRITKLSEKDETALAMGGKPMVGVFYFSDKVMFLDIAREILHHDATVKGEFYMSQSIYKMLDRNMLVYGYKVDNVIPLGTPEDIIKVKEPL